MILILFLALVAAPIAVSATLYAFSARAENWQIADRSSAGLLPQPAAKPEAAVRIYAARTVRWKQIFAVHSWIVFKENGAPSYTRYDYTAWGEPIRVNGFAADGRWFGEVPETVFAADGAEAEKLIPKIKQAIAAYEYRNYGDYRAWPGPNSNTFVAAIIDAVPEMRTTLPPTAVGKDFPYDRNWLSSDRHRLSRDARRLPHADRRLDRRHRAQPARRRGRPRHPPACDQAAGPRPHRHERVLARSARLASAHRYFGVSRSIAKSSNHGRSRPAISSPIICAAR